MENVFDLAIKEVKNGASQYYFYVPTTKSFAAASVSYVYDLVKCLRSNGFLANVLHDKEYKVPKWMGDVYSNLPHVDITSGFKMRASDFLFLPEAFVQTFYKDLQTNNVKLPCEVIVLSQMHEMIYFSLEMGRRWSHFGIKNVLTTTQKQAEYINNSMRGMNIEIVSPYIHEHFKKYDKPQKCMVMVLTRDKYDGDKLVKEFCNAYPHYAWIPFKIVNNMDREMFARELSECCLAVWVDAPSSFGTFPVECMKSGVPVIGLIPSMVPDWMESGEEDNYKIKNNGVWVNSKISIPAYISYFMNKWLTDDVEQEIYDEMDITAKKYEYSDFSAKVVDVFGKFNNSRIKTLELMKETDNHNKNIKNIKDAK